MQLWNLLYIHSLAFFINMYFKDSDCPVQYFVDVCLPFTMKLLFHNLVCNNRDSRDTILDIWLFNRTKYFNV